MQKFTISFNFEMKSYRADVHRTDMANHTPIEYQVDNLLPTVNKVAAPVIFSSRPDSDPLTVNNPDLNPALVHAISDAIINFCKAHSLPLS